MKIKLLFLLVSAAVFVQCKAPKDKNTPETNAQGDSSQQVDIRQYGELIKAENLKEKLYILASDEFEGRETGEPGQKKAAQYLSQFYIDQEIESPLGESNYYQSIPSSYFDHRFKDTENVVAIIEGQEFPDEIVVISGHYDHLGVSANGEIYNGADDDGSGTVAVMEMAAAFKKAADEGHKPRRTLMFLHLTGEEKGLLGSKFYVENPIYPLNKTVANLNIDMIGRIDEKHRATPEYVYVIGSNRLSSEMDSVVNRQNREFTQLELDYTYNAESDPNRFYYRSDHYNFAKHNIPVTFFFNGVHDDYHKPTDTPEKIEYELLEKRTQLIFYIAWEIANRDKPLKVDKAGN